MAMQRRWEGYSRRRTSKTLEVATSKHLRRQRSITRFAVIVKQKSCNATRQNALGGSNCDATQKTRYATPCL